MHKNDFGHVLIVAGSPSMLGAAALTGLAAMRAGAGLTTIATPKSLNLTLQQKISPVIMTLPLPETKSGTIAPSAWDILKKLWNKYGVVAIGPGMTTEMGTARLVYKMYRECPLPMVLDADALNALAGKMDKGVLSSAGRILTPHPGEMARLVGCPVVRTDGERKKAASFLARRSKCVVVLKGHRTVVASPEGKVVVNNTGNPGMATAGSGDVLTGMVAALVAQGLEAFEAARFGVWWHGRAGDEAVRRRLRPVLLAVDLIDCIDLKR